MTCPRPHAEGALAGFHGAVTSCRALVIEGQGVAGL